MNRRSFLGTMAAMVAAPAIVRAESLMKCTGIIVPSDPWPGWRQEIVQGLTVWLTDRPNEILYGGARGGGKSWRQWSQALDANASSFTAEELKAIAGASLSFYLTKDMFVSLRKPRS